MLCFWNCLFGILNGISSSHHHHLHHLTIKLCSIIECVSVTTLLPWSPQPHSKCQSLTTASMVTYNNHIVITRGMILHHRYVQYKMFQFSFVHLSIHFLVLWLCIPFLFTICLCFNSLWRRCHWSCQLTCSLDSYILWRHNYLTLFFM